MCLLRQTGKENGLLGKSLLIRKPPVERSFPDGKKGKHKMNILVINCGSSSLKYQLIDSISEKVLAKLKNVSITAISKSAIFSV